LLVLFEYLTVFHDKISNKKNYFKNNEFFYIIFYIINIIKGDYIQVYVKKRMIGFKLMMFKLEKRNSRNDITFIICIFVIKLIKEPSYTAYWKFDGGGSEISLAKSN